MRKEIVFAIILGLLVGLVITYGIYRSRQGGSDNTLDLQPSPTPASDSSTNAGGDLVLLSPQDEDIVTSPEVTIAGTTTPQAFVVIFVNTTDYTTTADSSGNFSITATLESGSNVIIVYALNEDGQKSIQERVVVYTTQPLESTAPQATESASTQKESDE